VCSPFVKRLNVLRPCNHAASRPRYERSPTEQTSTGEGQGSQQHAIMLALHCVTNRCVACCGQHLAAPRNRSCCDS
jgi:hypothetical protein